jgi:hypothetical protein
MTDCQTANSKGKATLSLLKNWFRNPLLPLQKFKVLLMSKDATIVASMRQPELRKPAQNAKKGR